MSEVVNPTGTVSGTTLTSFTSAEAATGTFGTMDRGNMQEIGARTRFLDTTGNSGETAWTAPTLLNSWVNFGGSSQVAGFYKDKVTSRVFLRGQIKSGTTTADTILFTLPSGYRPTASESYPIVSNGVFGDVYIDTSGNVRVGTTISATSASLSGISFRTT